MGIWFIKIEEKNDHSDTFLQRFHNLKIIYDSLDIMEDFCVHLLSQGFPAPEFDEYTNQMDNNFNCRF